MVNPLWEGIVSASFDAPLSKCSGITDPDLDHPNKIQSPLITKNTLYLSVDLLSTAVLIERGLWKKALSDS